MSENEEKVYTVQQVTTITRTFEVEATSEADAVDYVSHGSFTREVDEDSNEEFHILDARAVEPIVEAV